MLDVNGEEFRKIEQIKGLIVTLGSTKTGVQTLFSRGAR